MKYNPSNPPIICMQTQSDCYKSGQRHIVRGILFHSTAANNPNIKRYVQPSDDDPNRTNLLSLIGVNQYHNDWNHIHREAGLNAWIGKLADGTISTVQTMPYDFKPWGCGSGSKGSCNNGWIQFEICEANIYDTEYFRGIYTEAVEFAAYLCKLYGINPLASVTMSDGVLIPTITCHNDAAKLEYAGNHSDINHWFPKHGKNMSTVRADIANLIGVSSPDDKVITFSEDNTDNSQQVSANTGETSVNIENEDISSSVANEATITNTNTTNTTPQEPTDNLYRVRKSWDSPSSQIGAFKVLQNAINICKEGYYVFDSHGVVVYPVQNSETNNTNSSSVGADQSKTDISNSNSQAQASTEEVENKPSFEINLNATECFTNSQVKSSFGTKSGRYYLWDDKVINGRVRITTKLEYRGIPNKVTCWINKEDAK